MDDSTAVRRPHPIRLQGWPIFSRAGNAFVVLAYLALPVGLTVVRLAFTNDRDVPPLDRALAGVIGLLVGFGPLAVAYFPRRFARFGLLRWLLAPTQAGATLDEDGLELCAPGSGCKRFSWAEIASLKPDDAWLRGSFVTADPVVELSDSTGNSLMRVPRSVYTDLDPVGSRWRSGPRTLAEHVVARRRDRYVFVDSDHYPPHLWFKLADHEADH
jgi:hypothetical protein